MKTALGVAAVAAWGSFGLAPSAAADPQCTEVTAGTTRCANPGNVQINTSPVQRGPALPYGCDPAYAALCYDDIPGIAIDIGGRDHDGGGGGRRPSRR
ncbi:MAG TPA: hypothetical protein VL179_08845 [Mycobacterium sp.]|nr:hypothetical protein [Mycobacterium sp.]